MSSAPESPVIAACHCKRVAIRLKVAPVEVVLCNCSLCSSYGVLWAYYPTDEVTVTPETAATDTYAWNGRHVDFHRCKHCGCVTHWVRRGGRDERRGVNARLLPPAVLANAQVRRRDGAGTGVFVD